MNKDKLFELYQKVIRYIPYGFRPPPLRISYKVTSCCNLSCRMCPGVNGKDLCLNDVKKVIDKIARVFSAWPFRPTLGILGGEPFMRKDILDIVDYIIESGLNCELVTNGILLDEHKIRELCDSGITEISFSLDGLADYHDNMRGKGTFNSAMGAVKLMCRHDSENKIIKNINTIVSSENLSQLNRFIGLFSGLNVVHKLMPILTREFERQDCLQRYEIVNKALFYGQIKALSVNNFSKEIYSRLLDSDYERKNSTDKCSVLNWKATIDPDGAMRVCKRMQSISLLEEDFMSIFNHPAIRRKRLAEFDKIFCNGCSSLYGCKLYRLSDLLKEMQ